MVQATAACVVQLPDAPKQCLVGPSDNFSTHCVLPVCLHEKQNDSTAPSQQMIPSYFVHTQTKALSRQCCHLLAGQEEGVFADIQILTSWTSLPPVMYPPLGCGSVLSLSSGKFLSSGLRAVAPGSEMTFTQGFEKTVMYNFHSRSHCCSILWEL